jgi:hypothetical protein
VVRRISSTPGFEKRLIAMLQMMNRKAIVDARETRGLVYARSH